MSIENDVQTNVQGRMRAAVLGSPIAHSLSPVIHNAAYLALGIEGKYDAVEVGSGELSNFMNEVKQTPANWIGFSLTMPLKEEILNIADVVDPLARRINSGNTLIPTKEGWYATSTDVSGFIWALAFNEIKEFEKVQIIGAGATARAVAAAIDAPGRTICVINRNSQRNSAMQSVVLDSNLEFCNWEEAELDADLVVNTTPKNAADSLSSGSGILFDVIYDPWPTTLAAKWNGRVIDGLELLVHQAIDQISLMTGFVIDRQLMAPLLRAAAEAELNDRQ
jgi:shikimate dehydrogenase